MRTIVMNSFSKALLPLILASLTLSLSACSGVKSSLTAQRPGDEAFRTVLKKEMSSLSVAIEASSGDLSKALNKTVHKELYKGSTGSRGLSAEVLRNGPITVSAADNYIYLTQLSQ